MKWMLFFLLVPVVSALEITEIMYNPPGNDNNQEYVELYSEEEMNLSDYTLEDSSSSDPLVLVMFFDSPYYLLVEDEFNYSGLNASIYSAGASLGNNLNNQQDIVMLRDEQGNVVDVLQYDHTMGGNGNGQALCKNMTIYECVSTPGGINVVNVTLPVNVTNATEEVSYDGLILSELLPNPQGLDSDSLPDGEWVELYNGGSDVDMAGLELCDAAWNCVVVNDGIAQPSAFVRQDHYVILYMNGKSLLNNNGEERVRLIHEGNVLDEVVYDGSEEGLSWSLVDGAWVMTSPTQGSTNIKDVVLEDEKDISQSRLLFKKISVGKDNMTAFGETVDVRLWVYKGDTKKERIMLYVENISEKLQFHAVEKYQAFEVVLPLVLDENCEEEHRHGRYKIIAEGLDTRMTDSLMVNGSSRGCKQKKQVTILPKKHEVDNVVNSNPDQKHYLTGQTVYTSADKDVITYGMYGLGLVLVMGLGYLFVKR